MEQERFALVGDPETGEIYAAQVIDEEKRGHGEETLPMVRIIRVARYPDQRAIQDHDVTLERPALAYGTILRMRILRELSEEEREAFLSQSWKQSLRAAMKQALKDAQNEREREIIRRHLDGQVWRERRVRSYTREEIRIMQALDPGRRAGGRNTGNLG